MRRLSREQVRRVDRLAVERYHIPGIVLMENASRGVADVACQMLGFIIPAPGTPAFGSEAQARRGEGQGGGRIGTTLLVPPPQPSPGIPGEGANAKSIAIICGGGNNGGDGLAAARHLHNRGLKVAIFLTTDPAKYTGDALINWQIVRAMKLPVAIFDDPSKASLGKPDLILDAIFGTGLTQTPRTPFEQIVTAIQDWGAPILAVDIPSGLDCDTGQPLGPACLRATTTVTFVAEKTGFGQASARPYLGQVIVADIGCPVELIGEVE